MPLRGGGPAIADRTSPCATFSRREGAPGEHPRGPHQHSSVTPGFGQIVLRRRVTSSAANAPIASTSTAYDTGDS